MKRWGEKLNLHCAFASCDAATIRVVKSFFEEDKAFTQCDFYQRGRILLDQLAQPNYNVQIIILDEQCTDMDHIEFMEHYAKLNVRDRPMVFALCSKNQLGAHNQLVAYGASRCIVKPFQLSTITHQAKLYYETELYQIKTACEQLYDTWGVQEENACAYLTDAVAIVYNSPEKLPIRKEVILPIGQMRGISSAAIDSGLRRLIDKIESEDTPEYIAFKKKFALEKKPPIGKFVYALKRYVNVSVKPHN